MTRISIDSMSYYPRQSKRPYSIDEYCVLTFLSFCRAIATTFFLTALRLTVVSRQFTMIFAVRAFFRAAANASALRVTNVMWCLILLKRTTARCTKICRGKKEMCTANRLLNFLPRCVMMLLGFSPCCLLYSPLD